MNFTAVSQHFKSLSLFQVANRFGLPNVISLLLVRRYVVEGETRQEYRSIPNLVWDQTSPKTYGVVQGVDAREDEFKILGIPRNIDFVDWLQATGTSYWINAEMKASKVFGGFEVEFITLDSNNPLIYSLTVRRKPDERRFR